MRSFLQALQGGLLRAAQLRLALPLYLAALLLGLLQAWPAALAGGTGPLLDDLAAGTNDALVMLFIADPGAVTPVALLWSLLTLGAVLAYAAAYNLFSGGILSAWAGGAFWPGCRRFFWGFTGLGALLLLLAVLAIGAAILVGMVGGLTAATLTALGLLQLVGLWGEYARAAAVANGRASPLAALGAGARSIIRQPLGVLALAVLGLLLHAAIAAAYGALGGRVGWAAPILQQAAVLGWLWVKLLRLGWAAAYTRGGNL